MIIELFIILILAAIFFIIAKILEMYGILEKLNMAVYLIFVMWKTTMGRDLIEILAKPKKVWIVFATVGLVIIAMSGTLMLLMIAGGASVAFDPAAPSMTIQEILVIPGVNPMIPLWYGLFGLIIAVFVHEFSHGILSRVGKIKIRSLGILLLVIPVGAFVEPDQNEMMHARRKTRARVYAAGPASNIIFGLLCAVIFSWLFMGSVEPINEGVIIHISEDSPGMDAGIDSKMQLIDINGTRIETFTDLVDYNGTEPFALIPVQVSDAGEYRSFNVRYGVTISGVWNATPADDANLGRGWIVESLNDTVVFGSRDFTKIMEKTRPGQTVNASFYVPVSTKRGYIKNETGRKIYERVEYVNNITLDKKSDYISGGDASWDHTGYLGISSAPMGIFGQFTTQSLKTLASRPVLSAKSPGEAVVNVFLFAFILPIQHVYVPLQSPITDLYEVNGPLGILPDPIFWGLANIFYYLFWLNILLGTFNTLPAFPLDGGFIFKDAVDFFFWKVFKKKRQEREKPVNYVFFGISIIIGLLILWTLIAAPLARAIL